MTSSLLRPTLVAQLTRAPSSSPAGCHPQPPAQCCRSTFVFRLVVPCTARTIVATQPESGGQSPPHLSARTHVTTLKGMDTVKLKLKSRSSTQHSDHAQIAAHSTQHSTARSTQHTAHCTITRTHVSPLLMSHWPSVSARAVALVLVAV